MAFYDLIPYYFYVFLIFCDIFRFLNLFFINIGV